MQQVIKTIKELELCTQVADFVPKGTFKVDVLSLIAEYSELNYNILN